jgi:hypothetical protein
MATQTTGALVLSGLLMTLVTPPVFADDVCLGDEEQKTTKATLARIGQAEKSGKPAELFLAYQAGIMDDCLEGTQKGIMAKMRAAIPKLGRDLAAAAESKGLLYSEAGVRGDGTTSAFRYFETVGEYGEANRVLLKAVRSKQDDLTTFKFAWDVDHTRQNARDLKTGDLKPFTSPPAYRQELERVAATSAERLMKAEEKDAERFSGPWRLPAVPSGS